MEALIMDKGKIVEMLGEFPQSVVIEDLFEKVIIAAKLEKALDQLDRGEYMTSEELDEEIKKWG